MHVLSETKRCIRVLCLDYGEKTIGVSVSDPLGFSAQGLCVLRRDKEESIKKNVKQLSEIIAEYEIKLIVLGYPKNLDNTESERCKKTVLFKERLERNFKKIPVVLWDERLSTVGAGRTLSYLSSKEYKQIIDMQAAVFILQGFIDANKGIFTLEMDKIIERLKENNNE